MSRFIGLFGTIFPDGSDIIISMMFVWVEYLGESVLEKLSDHDMIAMMIRFQALLAIGDNIVDSGCSDTDKLLINQMLENRRHYAN